MREWQERILKKLKPKTIYNKDDAKALARCPKTFLDSFIWPMTGKGLIYQVLRYKGPQGRKLLPDKKRRKKSRKFRISESDYDFLKSYSALHGMTVSTIVRKALLDKCLDYGNSLTTRLVLPQLRELHSYFSDKAEPEIVKALAGVIFKLKSKNHEDSWLLSRKEIKSRTICVFFSMEELSEARKKLKEPDANLSEKLCRKITELYFMKKTTINSESIAVILRTHNDVVYGGLSYHRDELLSALEDIFKRAVA